MLVSCWSVKGGAGTTVVACALGLVLARSDPAGALLVDLAGDVPCALGLPDRRGPGVVDWLAAAPDVAADGLRRLEEPGGGALRVVRRGSAAARAPAAGAADLLCSMLASDPRPVVVDCGRLGACDDDGPAGVVAAGATRSLLVLRPCFLGVQRAREAPLRPSGIVLVNEPGRSLTALDIEGVLGVSVVATVRVTEQIARAVDAGVLGSALPRSLGKDLRHAA